MSTIPPAPRLPSFDTTPAAPVALRELCAELRASLEKTADLCNRVCGEIARVELAELATEHRLNVLSDLFTDDIVPRLEALEAARTAAE